MSAPPLAALENIASRRLPCRECGIAHTRWQILPGLWDWSDPRDGHGYQQEDPADYARRILEEYRLRP